MSRDYRAKRLAEEEGISYSAALRRVRDADADAMLRLREAQAVAEGWPEQDSVSGREAV